LTADELPEGMKVGVEYDTVAVNPALYLPWLKEQLLAKGVKFVRRKIHRIDEVREYCGPNGIVVNATALGQLYYTIMRYMP
jgi:D-amino-acid oxidase